jgi:hypothetical protein
MLAGSFASSYHGQLRTTYDIDLVIAPDRASLLRFIETLPEEDYYVSREAAIDALGRRSQFNVIDLASGWKVDLIIRKNRAFSIAEFERRESAEILGVRLRVASAEDTILAKLEWAKKGGSERQLRDIRGILDVKGESLDRHWIERWLDDLEVRSLWEEVVVTGS